MNPSIRKWMDRAARLASSPEMQQAGDVVRQALTRAGLMSGAAVTAAAQPATSAAPAQHVEPPVARRAWGGRPPVDVTDVFDLRETAARAAASVGSVRPAPVGSRAPAGGDGEAMLKGSHGNAAGTRAYKLYLPPGHGAAGAGALPLVVMLHGCTQDPDDFAAGTGMNAAARQRGFAVLYPAQSQQANPARCWNWFKHNHQRRDSGEPSLLAGMTRDVVARHGLDPRRVYVAGLSAGGAMAAILGRTYPDVYAAVGVHSGLPVGAATDVGSALEAMRSGAAGAAGAPGVASPPTIVFHGDADATVHPSNGGHVAARSAGVDAASAEAEARRRANGREYTRRVYRDRSGRVAVEHWDVHGGGHAWSGGRPEGSYTDAQGPVATDEMLRFFLAHELPRTQ